MSLTPESLYNPPNALAPHYSRFRVQERLLLTGHSHQAWPDVGYEGHQRAWDDAAQFVDDKWERAFEQAERVRTGWRRLLDDSSGDYALGANTHELLVRWLSALPLRTRPRLVTTDGEFHTIRRQLHRLREEGFDIVRVPSRPVDDLAERLVAAADDRTAAVLVSAVLFEDARIVPNLGSVAAGCDRVGVSLLVDAYHALNAIPFTVPAQGLETAFVIGGGYKYCQLGEGNCFLRVPADCTMRPVITGWFAEFATLDRPAATGVVEYGDGASRFAGATYDPTSHYRAAAVFDFFDEHHLVPSLLREVSQHHVGVLCEAFDALSVDPAVIDRDRATPLDQFGGFLALRTPRAADLVTRLRRRGVFVDARGDLLRFGPAPYLTDQQLRDAIGQLGECLAANDRPGAKALSR